MAGSGATLSIAGRIWRTWLSASRGFGATGSSIPIAIGSRPASFPGDEPRGFSDPVEPLRATRRGAGRGRNDGIPIGRAETKSWWPLAL